MTPTTTDNQFRYYMHEGPTAFSFELSGRLSDEAARELEHARRSASFVAGGRPLIVDLSYVTQVDSEGQRLLRDWYDDGARLVATSPQARTMVESITGQAPEFIAAVAPHQTWLPFRVAALWAIGLMMLLAPTRTFAADLKPETIQTWEAYIKAVGERDQGRLVSGSPFLAIDETPDQAARLRAGEIVVSPVGPHVPLKVPSGLIHDWAGDAFLPNVTIPDVLRVVRDYGRYKNIYQPGVLDSKPTATSEAEDRFSLLLMNKSVIAKTALDSDYRSSYTRLDDQHWFSVTEATRIQEVAEYGASSQHTLPANQGTGLIWRLYSVTRFQERDGGVYVEVEAIALSRDVPASLRWLVDPIVRRISRSSLVTSLQQTGDAVRLDTSNVSRSHDRTLCPSRTTCAPAAVPSAVGPVRSFR
jgi:ABC-type transporter Mla MlaB component